jgi:hypothetical protein
MEDKEQYWKINKKWAKRIILLSFVALVVGVVIFPQPEKHIDRQRINVMYSILHGVEHTIEEQLQDKANAVNLDARKAIPRFIGLKSSNGEEIELSFREITPQGEIKAFSPQLGVILVLTPKFDNSNVTWSCWGSPNKYLPRECR